MHLSRRLNSQVHNEAGAKWMAVDILKSQGDRRVVKPYSHRRNSQNAPASTPAAHVIHKCGHRIVPYSLQTNSSGSAFVAPQRHELKYCYIL